MAGQGGGHTPELPLQKLAQAMCSLDLAESNWIQDLPRLPVPDLWLTASKYLSSLRAVLDPEEGRGGRPLDEAGRRQFKRTTQLVHQFMLDPGPQLQRDLKEYANRCQNWATDFWLQDMYLSNPAPLPVNSNPFFLFPRQQFGSSEEMLMFATRIIQFSVDFKCQIDRQTLKQDLGSGQAKGLPLCMETYKHFFHSYRMPHDDSDRLLPQSRRSNHIVVASCDQFYILRLGQDPLQDPYDSSAARLLPEASIYEQLLRIYRCSRERLRRSRHTGSGVRVPQIGLLTSEHRRTWARLHKKLARVGAESQPQHQTAADEPPRAARQVNSDSLRQIEDCLFVMCLDSLVPESPARGQPGAGGSAPTDEQAARVILTGGGSRLFTANRWFDKFLQVIVGRDGVCGINIEHSASEGITVIRFLEDFLAFLRAHPMGCRPAAGSGGQFSFEPAAGGPSVSAPGYQEPLSPDSLVKESDSITPLEWLLDEELERDIEAAAEHADRLIGNFCLNILNFELFGRDFIKSQSLSPDAFIQMALQYTFFRLHGKLVSSYESASLRQFRLGRVDNIRANTCEAYEWIQAMLACRSSSAPAPGPPHDWTAAEQPFMRAIAKQVEILKYTITGSGPDNHLLALKQLAQVRFDEDLPDLFQDPSYREFLNFRLSTSQLPNRSGITVGYGAVVPDGYGCSYSPCPDSIVFCVSSFADCPETDSAKFAAELVDSLKEMQQLCLARLGRS